VQALSQKFIRVARWVGLVLIAIAAWSVPAAVAAPPQITVSPEPPTGWLSSGEYPITVSAAGGEYDIHSLEWRLEGGPVTWFTKLCAVVKEPCPKQASATGVLRPAELPDGVWDLVVGVKYSPVRVGNFLSTGEVTRRFRLMVDHDAPSPPTGLALAGGDGWRSTNRFDVHWTPFAPDGGTSIVGSDYRICRASNPPRSDIGCITGRRYGSAVDGIAGISVPGTGVWRLEVALRDELGHVNLDAGATIPELRLDADAPRLAFLARSASDPARVQLSATDEGSGLRSVEIEARRQGEKSWRALSVSAHEGSLTALLDDDDLPAGKYEIRGHAVDAVGNERSIGLENAELIELPVRQASKLSAGKPTAGRKGGTKLDPRPSIPFAARVQLRGRVTDAFGTGRARVNVEVLERLAMPGVAWRPLTTIRTDENGSFRYTAPQSMARTVRFQYAGTPTTPPVQR
jgi:hypothetical protein